MVGAWFFGEFKLKLTIFAFLSMEQMQLIYIYDSSINYLNQQMFQVKNIALLTKKMKIPQLMSNSRRIVKLNRVQYKMNKFEVKQKDKKGIAQPITQFSGFYEFLSIDYLCPVYYQGFIYPSITTAFQAARTNDTSIRRKILEAKDKTVFRNILSTIKNSIDWNEKRLNVMLKLNRDKFKRNKQLGLKLFATQSRQIINCYDRGGDAQAFWGMILRNNKYEGLNTLGKILVQIRQDMKNNTDCVKWVEEQNIEIDDSFWPKTNIVVQKQGIQIENFALSSKNMFFFGSHNSNDFRLDHGSLSKFHACIYFSSNMEVILVDLNSTNGTIIRRGNLDIKLSPLFPKSLQNKDIIHFGMSTRKYICYFSFQEAQSRMKIKQENVMDELGKIKKLKQLEKDKALDTNFDSEKQIIKSLLQLKEYSCLYVEGVTKAFPYQVLKQIFNRYGSVRNIRINIDQKTGKYMGSALIYFQSGVKINNILDNIQNQAQLPSEFKIKPVFHNEAEDIISNFSTISSNSLHNTKISYNKSKNVYYRKDELSRSRSRDNHKVKLQQISNHRNK